ncbi:hypothetical protein EC973_009293 [Apophysomyces ossiformis]|uniref:RNA helicase n=1 Tax=Apophysomyces ossiformis TaxID=679940 RepID=A0A8H7ET22_9FUNG|nr:hypothetical protein EC973_009293 [Apophysomyces ossiformis]
MARKTKKLTSNRGYATSSLPSKQVTALNETPAVAEAASVTPTVRHEDNVAKDMRPNEEESKDHVLTLVKRFDSLNEWKAQKALDMMSQEEHHRLEQKSFALPSELEHELLQVLKAEGNINKFPAVVPSACQVFRENEKDKTVEQLDLIYRILLKLGFNAADIEQSLRASLSLEVQDHLDWLCINVPYERMPVGLFDKYYTENDTTIEAVSYDEKDSSVQAKDETPRHITQPAEPIQVVSTLKAKGADEINDDYKSRIMRAAQQYMEEEEEQENVNEKHARLKFEMSTLEQQLPSKKKGKRGKKDTDTQMTDTELIELQKKVKDIQQTLCNIEADWEYDKSKAAELYVAQQQKAAKEREDRRQNPETAVGRTSDPATETAVKPELMKEEEDDDDDEYSLFGGLMLEQMENSDVGASHSVTKWNVVNVVTSSWKGKYPKHQLQDQSKRHGYITQKYSTSNIGTGLWRASVSLTSRYPQDPSVTVEIPEGLAATNAGDAEQLAAAAALFHLDPDATIYRTMPQTVKDLWLKWKDDKEQMEAGPRLEAGRSRIQFLYDLLETSSQQRKTRKGKELKADGSKLTDHTMPILRESLPKRKEIFSRVQQSFVKRLETEKYQGMKKKRGELPVSAYRKDILHLVKENQVIIISGETGCGKSTQVPQFIAEDLLQNSAENGMVICTQPRRISAISIANRVSAEMGDKPHSTGSPDSLVGYQIRLESKASKENVLLFCTTGILLRRLESDQYLEGVTHVVVDEVHERTVESDFLLIVLKRLCVTRPNLRVILMSATVEAHRFSSYFGNCPVLSVPGRTFPVQVKYLEDVIQTTEEESPYAIRRSRVRQGTVTLKYFNVFLCGIMNLDQGSIDISGKHGSSKRVRLEWFEEDTDDEDPYDFARYELKLKTVDTDEAENNDKYSKQTYKMIRRMDEYRINYDLILQLFEHICIKSTESDTNIPMSGAILVFLPGMPEIRRLYDLLSGHSVLGDSTRFLLIALHSTLSSEHQERAFDIPPEGVRKIVLSTNIAETGVTISDVTIVIDTGMAKIVSYEEKKRITRLRQTFVAKANARQRRGRAGRVQEGICFHLFTQERYDQMPDYEKPEILRLPLEELCLRIKVCNLGSIHEVLAAALDAPSKKMIDNAVQTLQEVQALSSDESQTLTPLGAHLAHLPVDVHIGKMILFGAIFRCLDPVLTVAASLSFKSPFVRPFGKESEADVAREKFRYANSDFWTIYKAYCSWREHLQRVRQQPRWTKEMHKFCSKHFLSQQNLEMIEDMKQQYLELLVSIGFVKLDKQKAVHRYELKRANRICHVPGPYDVHSDKVAVVNAAIVAGLYPKIAAYSREKNQFMNDILTVQIHPSSVLHRSPDTLQHDFLTYNTIVMSEKVYLWETASIKPAIVLLLAKEMVIKHKTRCVVLDRWIPFKCYARTAVLIKFLRTELNNWLAAKMDTPSLDLTNYGQEIMNVWIKALEV